MRGLSETFRAGFSPDWCGGNSPPKDQEDSTDPLRARVLRGSETLDALGVHFSPTPGSIAEESLHSRTLNAKHSSGAF